MTAFPQGADMRELGSPVVVVRVRPARRCGCRPARAGWAPEGILAFSKICTHAGCAVALYRSPLDEQTSSLPALVCPCHYSTFDVRRGAAVEFGPAGRPLPQLPLAIRADRVLVAAGGFSARSARRGGACGAKDRRGPHERSRGAGADDADATDAVRFVDERLGASPLLRKALRYLFPDHWSFLIGEIALYSFVVLIATGTYLALFFDAEHVDDRLPRRFAPLVGQTVSHGLRVDGRLSSTSPPGC